MAKPALKQIADDVSFIREEMVERVPHHFTAKQMVASVFGALVFGLTFALKGLLLDVTERLTQEHIAYMLGAIVVILSAEIYYIGYSHVKNKDQRRFGQFWLKRISAYLIVGFAVSWFLTYLYGINNLVMGPEHLRNTIVALALPCCIGAGIADLLKQY